MKKLISILIAAVLMTSCAKKPTTVSGNRAATATNSGINIVLGWSAAMVGASPGVLNAADCNYTVNGVANGETLISSVTAVASESTTKMFNANVGDVITITYSSPALLQIEEVSPALHNITYIIDHGAPVVAVTTGAAAVKLITA